MFISLCFDMFPGEVCRLVAGGGGELHHSLLTLGLWGMAHTWKHFRASLHCNWAYYHNYSFKAPAICIRHAPAQPPGHLPQAPTAKPPPPLTLSLSTHFSLSLHVRFLSFFSVSTFSGYINIRGEGDYSGAHHVGGRMVHAVWAAQYERVLHLAPEDSWRR